MLFGDLNDDHEDNYRYDSFEIVSIEPQKVIDNYFREIMIAKDNREIYECLVNLYNEAYKIGINEGLYSSILANSELIKKINENI